MPAFGEEALHLAKPLRMLEPDGLKSLMSLSADLAEQTSEELNAFGARENRYGAALWTYTGTAFKALAPEKLDERALEYARSHLRILSGMYGILRPFDRIEPHRLDLGTPVSKAGLPSLMSFWKDRVNSLLESEPVLLDPSSILLNLASGEYSRLVDSKRINRRMVNVEFRTQRAGRLSTIGHYSKLCRGTLARLVLENRPTELLTLQSWEIENHFFSSEHSAPDRLVFIRNL